MHAYEAEDVWFPCSLDIRGWDEAFHDLMLGDRLRMEAYQRAITRAVRRGDVVVDLGTGTGILARWALEAGAARVYGIECNAHMLEIASKRLKEANYPGEFIPVNALSYDAQLPERVDLVISEIIGNIADNENCVPILDDARRRFLKPTGRMLPISLSSHFVPVCSERAHQQIAQGVCKSVSQVQSISQLLDVLGMDSPFKIYYDVILPKSTYVSAPKLGLKFDLQGGASALAGSYSIDLEFAIIRAAVLTGFKGFFIAQLTDVDVLDIEESDNGSARYSDSWKHCYLPLLEPLAVEVGDRVRLSVSRRDLTGSGAPLLATYAWKAALLSRKETLAQAD